MGTNTPRHHYRLFTKGPGKSTLVATMCTELKTAAEAKSQSVHGESEWLRVNLKWQLVRGD